MTFAGFVLLSLCDYPGCVASVLFTQGCNFRCPWCHNPHLVPATPPDGAVAHDEDAVVDMLASRRTRVEGVVVTGGEPTLHAAELSAFLRRLRALGLRIKLDTNGSRPEVLRALFDERLLDYVAMDIKAPWARYAALTGLPACDVAALQDSVALIAGSGVAHQFRTTRVDPLLSESDYEAIRQQIPNGSPHVWQTFRPDVCLAPGFLSTDLQVCG